MAVGETDPPTPMGTGPLSVRRGAEAAQRADRGGTREQFLPSFGPHGCVKPYCCLFGCIEFLLRSDGRCQTERESVPDVSNEPNPPLRCAWASFYTFKGSPIGSNVD